MNFYASPAYLGVVADVYFKGKSTRIDDVRVGDEVLRLLVVEETRAITNALFLDYHQPLRQPERLTREANRRVLQECDYAESVVRGAIDAAAWEPSKYVGLDLAPYIDWGMFATYDDYKVHLLQRQKGLVRERERRQRRLVEHVGPLVFQADDRAPDVIDVAGRWKSRQLRETGLRDFFANPSTGEYIGLLKDRGLLTSSTLRTTDGRLLSAWLGFIHDRIWSGWVFAYDPEFAKYSVGHQLLASMLEESHRRGHREFDFSTGAEGYKMPYATHGRVLGPIGRAPLRQRIAARVKSEARRRTPDLFERARAIKRALVSTMDRARTRP